MDVTEIRNLVDKYIETRTKRKAKQAEADLLDAQEKELKKLLIAASFAVQTRVLAGQTGTVERDRKIKPTAKNWDEIYKYIVAHDAFDLLQRRLGEKAISERWNDGIEIPGIEKFPVDDLTIKGEKA